MDRLRSELLKLVTTEISNVLTFMNNKYLKQESFQMFLPITGKGTRKRLKIQRVEIKGDLGHLTTVEHKITQGLIGYWVNCSSVSF